MTQERCLPLLFMCCIYLVRGDSVCDLYMRSGELEADCSSLKLSAPPGDLTDAITHLSLDKNKLSELRNSGFRGKERLVQLTISQNNISFISDMAFKDASRLEYLDISHNFISSISVQFHFLQYLKHLDLSHNMLPAVSAGLVSMNRYLEYFDLSYNKIGYLNNKSLTGLDNLTYLNLLHNELCFNDMSYPIGLSLHRVQFLGLFSKFECADAYPDYLIEKLESVRNLTISATNPFSLSGAFSTLHTLETFSLYNQDCILDVLNQTTFSVFENVSIKSFSIVNCSINIIENLTFTSFKQLKTLNLASSLKMSLGESLNFIRNIPSQLDTLVLDNTMHKEKNSVIEPETFCMDSLQKLRRLSIKHLHFASVHVDFIKCLKYLTQLSVAYNAIQKVLPINYYQHLFHLRQQGHLSSLETIDASFMGAVFFRLYNLHGGPLDVETYFRQPPKYVLDAPNIVISNNTNPPEDPNDFFYGYAYFPKAVYLDHNFISFEEYTPSLILNHTGIFQTRLYNISHVQLPCLCLSVSGWDTLHIFDASSCGIQLILLDGTFNGLCELYMSNNQLFLTIDTLPKYFSTMPNVKLIDLSANRLGYLHKATFRNNLKLETLLLRDNSFQHLEFEILQLKSLIMLDVSNNLLQYLHKNTTQTINLMPNVTLNLWNNPFSCHCPPVLSNIVNSVESIQMNSDKYYKVNRYYCIQNVRLLTVDIKDLKDKCIKQDFKIYNSYKFWLGISFGILFLFTLVTILLYTNQWRIRYHYYKLQHRAGINSGNRRKCKFDLYVHYAQQSENALAWVTQQLLPHCREWEIQLCFEGKDFLPGGSFAEDIVGAIDESINTLLVVSNDCAKDEWYHFTLNMALVKGLDYVILVIIDDPIDLRHRNARLLCKVRDTISTSRRLNTKDRHFWQSLRKLTSKYRQGGKGLSNVSTSM